jgi:lipopolysaccharide/colanic/teichoic acid biosynthesis glycosyltransferase
VGDGPGAGERSSELVHKVKPRIISRAWVHGRRGETDDVFKMEKRIERGLCYIRNRSLSSDIKIILLTVMRGFSGKSTDRRPGFWMRASRVLEVVTCNENG